MAPFICLTQKDQPFFRGVEVDNTFQSLKESFMTAPFLTHVQPSKPFVLGNGFFDFVVGIVLSQLGEVNLHPINFRSCKFSPTKINYKIHDKEPSWMPLKNGIIFLKEFNMKSLYTFKP
jgi:hypothetical protein